MPEYTTLPTSDPFMAERVPANGLRAARGIRNGLLLAPLAWAVLIAFALFVVGVL